MNGCVSSISKGDHNGKIFSTAIEAYDYLEANDFIGTIESVNMSWDQRVKFCRWINGSRCEHLKTVLFPG